MFTRALKISLTSSLLLLFSSVLLHTSPSFSQSDKSGPKDASAVQTSAPKQLSSLSSLQQTLSISGLKIEMAESTWKIRPSLKSLAELANALEGYLNENCFGSMLQTLSYSGPPTDPDCIARMDRLLDIYPNNPVATCLRDGIESQSCSDTYRGQSMKQFNTQASLEETPDPALRVGLTAADRDKLKAISETLSNVNHDYQNATVDEIKQQHMENSMHLYDQALSVACKIVALQLEDPLGSKGAVVEDFAVREIREKLLKVPPALRAEYQNKLMTQAEEELAKAKNSPFDRELVLKKIEAIQKPEVDNTPTAVGKLRYRVVLPECYDLVGRAAVVVPSLPSPTCHRDGWQSPQCFAAVKRWHAYRKQIADKKKLIEERSKPTPGSQIGAF
jgi:hypothetical protein